MATMNLNLTEKAHAMEMLKKYCPIGTEVHCVIRSVARSGLSRRMSFFVLDGQRIQHIGGWVATVFKIKLGRDLDVRVDGGGMDMGFHMVSQLSRVLYGNEVSLTHHWI